MAGLSIVLGSKILEKIELKKDRAYVIGRAADADIRLENVMVSRKHAKVYQQNGIWQIEDISGKNGVQLDGKPIQKSELHNKNVIWIGKFMLTFAQSQAEFDADIRAAIEDDDDDQPARSKAGKGVSTDPLRALAEARARSRKAGTAAPELVSEDTMMVSRDKLVSLRAEMRNRMRPHLTALTEMEQKTYILDKSRSLIGSLPEAEIRLPSGLFIAKEHAFISEEGGTWIIVHASGLSALKINGRKIAKAERVALSDGDIIEIGSHKLKFTVGLQV